MSGVFQERNSKAWGSPHGPRMLVQSVLLCLSVFANHDKMSNKLEQRRTWNSYLYIK